MADSIFKQMGSTVKVAIDNVKSTISNVDNTSDLDKPISTATQTAFDSLRTDLETEISTNIDTSLNSNQTIDGNWSFNGTVTSTSFYGDGSNLTGIESGANLSSITENIMPSATQSYNIGSGTVEWNEIYSKNIYASGDFINSSDRTLKENIRPIENASEIVSDLQGVFYNFIDVPEKVNVGLIAQDVEQILPEVVYTTDAGTKAIAYANIVAVLIEAVKNLQEEINILKLKSGE